MQSQKKLVAIRQTLGRETLTKGDEVVFYCPRPHPGVKQVKPKLSVNLSTDRFHCWICGFGGKTLLPLMPKGTAERAEYASGLESFSKIIVPKKTYDSPVLPDEFRSLSKKWPGFAYKATMAYLSQRGVSNEDILKWKLGYCEDGDFKYRVIFPSFDEFGELNFCVGRAIYPKMLKYKHGEFDKDIIFNDYMIDWRKPIVITEGPFDAVKAGFNAIPLQGTILTPDLKLYRKIVMSGVDVFFAMDKDAFSKQLRIMDGLLSYGVACHYVDLGGKNDVGEMTHTEFEEAKRNSREVKCDTDLLKLRILS